ncbi:metallophosphoesterase family protein [Sphingomonas sp. GB1N7]|uniref:metallophosphoesterase family protein n=1 Tax=Parasphingomonas caseinilytica TaxID=3096158 RepID=UPI002FC77C0E
MTDATGSAQAVTVSRSPPMQSARATSTDGRIIYAIGDVHGCYDQFVALMEAIVADIAANPDDVPALLILCGDYVDRGPRSSDVLAALVWLSRPAPVEIVMLRGNHEEMLLGFLERPEEQLTWLQREGQLTLGSYGVPIAADPMAIEEADCRRLRDELSDRMPVSHLDLLRGLPVKKTCGDYIFVHAGFRPGVAISKQSDDDCLWIREEFLTRDHRFDKVVVHGHSWSSGDPVITPHRIGIDTGVYETGVLTAVRLEGATIEFLQARVAEAAIVPPATPSSIGPSPGGL